MPAVRRRARGGAAHLARDADRPRGHALGLRPHRAGHARRRPADGQRAQADADGARVRGGGGARPARLHRLRGRARPDPGARGPGAAGGRGARRRAADDGPPRQGPGVPRRLRGRPGQGPAARTTPPCGSPTTAAWASGWRSSAAARSTAPSLGQIREERKLEDEEEERRIFYVAATRAQEHLVLSGATDLEKLERARPLGEPMRWLWPALAPDLAQPGASCEAAELRRAPACACAARCCAPDTVDELLPAADRDPTAPEPVPPGLDALAAPALAAVPCPPSPAGQPAQLLGARALRAAAGTASTSSARSACRAPRSSSSTAIPSRSASPSGRGALEDDLSGLVRGSIVHVLLEALDFADPRPPSRDEVVERPDRAAGSRCATPTWTTSPRWSSGFVASSCCARVAARRRVRAELPFALHARAPGGAAC